MNSDRTKDLAVGGIIVALIVVLLYMGSIIRNSSIFLLALTLFISSIPYIRGSIRTGLTVYAASVLLALILVPDKLYAIYFCFTGIYPLIKLIAEKQNKLLLEFSLKYFYANIVLFTLYFIVTSGFGLNVFNNKEIKANYLILGGFVAYQIFFFIFDYCFSKFIMMYNRRLKI